MNDIAIYTLTSELHDENAVDAATREFLGTIDVDYDLRGSDFSDYGSHALSLIYVRTGGTEGIFLRLLPQLREQTQTPVLLLTSGKSNSLAASMEILSYLRQQGLQGEILHGSATYVNRRIRLLHAAAVARRHLQGCRLGIIGQPSDWLISSGVSDDVVRERLGIELVYIPMDEVIARVSPTSSVDKEHVMQGAEQIYQTLKYLLQQHHLQGFTIRCFDLLSAVHNTGCLALARLNAEGYVAGCEGDVPAMLSMMLVRAVAGVSGFQANPARIDPETGEMLFAHCTIPLDMVEHYEYDTHFESGIGVAIRGYAKEGVITIFKLSPDLQRSFIARGTLLRSQAEPDLCRTQQVIRLDDPSQATYFLTRPIGNHHIVVPGDYVELLTFLTNH